MTSYRIFFRHPVAQNSATPRDPKDWTLLDKSYTAGSSDAAAKQAAPAHNKPGEYAAIPERSWDPINLAIETNPRVKVVK